MVGTWRRLLCFLFGHKPCCVQIRGYAYVKCSRCGVPRLYDEQDNGVWVEDIVNARKE